MIKVRHFERIADVPNDWETLHDGHSLMQSRACWELIEAVGLNDVECHYLIAYDAQDQPMALCACYIIVTDVAIFAGPRLRRLLKRIRLWWPGFLQLKMLECGTPITINPPILVRPDQQVAPIVEAIDQELLWIAKKQRALIIVVRDFEQAENTQLAAFQNANYHIIDNLPNTYLEIQWQSAAEYHGAMKSYFRSKLFRVLRKNREIGVNHHLIDEFSAIAEELSAQWNTVSAHADEYQREVLGPSFYSHFSDAFSNNSKVLMFYRGDQWVAHALLLIDGNSLRWLYFGRTCPTNDGLYIYVANAVVETAINLRLSRVEMGLTTYPIKKDLGAKLVRTQMTIKSPWPMTHAVSSFVFKLLNRPSKIKNRTIFKKGNVA